MEFRTLAVDPRGALGPTVRALEAGRAPPAGFRPPAADVPWAHVLKRQATCVAGWDLPRALPPAAATWRPVALDAGLLRRLARALGRAEELRAAGRPGAAAAALRWGLKRLVRAAAELAVLRGVSRRPSRDLFWCAAEARRAFPPYAGHLRSAAELAVQPRLAGADLDAASRACLVLGAWLRAELARLASDGLLEAAPPAAAGGGARVRAGRRIKRGGGGRAVAASRRAQGARLRAAVYGAVLAVRLSEAEYATAAAVRGRRPPPLRAPSDRDVPCVALGDAPGVLEAMLTGRRAAHPFVVRGAARAGPGGEDLLGRLSLLSLAKQAPWERVSAQVSPSLDFRFCDPAALRAAGGRVAGPPPSRVASMPAAECLARMLLAPSEAEAGAGAGGGGGGGPGGLQGGVPPCSSRATSSSALRRSCRGPGASGAPPSASWPPRPSSGGARPPAARPCGRRRAPGCGRGRWARRPPCTTTRTAAGSCRRAARSACSSTPRTTCTGSTPTRTRTPSAGAPGPARPTPAATPGPATRSSGAWAPGRPASRRGTRPYSRPAGRTTPRPRGPPPPSPGDSPPPRLAERGGRGARGATKGTPGPPPEGLACPCKRAGPRPRPGPRPLRPHLHVGRQTRDHRAGDPRAGDRVARARGRGPARPTSTRGAGPSGRRRRCRGRRC